MAEKPARKPPRNTAGDGPDATPAPPSELVYGASDASRRGSSAVVMFKLFTAPVVVVIVLSQIAGSTVAVAGMIATAIAAVWWWKRAPELGQVVLHVDRGELWITSAKRTLAERVRLDDVDVVLDTVTIQKVQEGGSAIPAMRFIDATVAPDQDTARIVIVRGRERIPLTEDYVAYMEATEWFGKVRVFLRKNGWIPLDERE